MDVPRPQLRRARRLRHLLVGGGATLLLILVTVGLAQLEPAAPEVARGAVWVDVVREGEMLREVRGTGTLVPREVRWIAAQTEGRVERILVRPGAQVDADTVMIEMSNVDLQQQTEEARHALQAARGELTERRLRVRNQHLDQRATMAAARAEFEGARLQAEAEAPLAKSGIVPILQHRRSQLLAEQLRVRMEIEQDRLDYFSSSMESQLASSRAHVEQARNVYERRLHQLDALHVRPGLAGVLQQVMVEPGQRLAVGTNIARVARPEALWAELRVPETQARDVQVGQRANIDTHNGTVEGRVARIDPAVQGGTVQVDIELTGTLPRGARPDLTVEGTIEIERLAGVVFTGRPAGSQGKRRVLLFKLVDARGAVRVPVEIGRVSVNTAEIVNGLRPGDQVILSDTSMWNDHDRIQLK